MGEIIVVALVVIGAAAYALRHFVAVLGGRRANACACSHCSIPAQCAVSPEQSRQPACPDASKRTGDTPENP